MPENSEEKVVLEIQNLYVGYYRDLNILQDITIKVRKNQNHCDSWCKRSRKINCAQSSFRIFTAKCR